MHVRRMVAILALLACCTLEVRPQNQLPPRPPIFLNNNASLYTFPNPNFGKPSQLPFAFVAVAHEDCRLFHNGAKLMPKHRLMAAECIQSSMTMPPGGGGGVPIDPLTGLPIGTNQQQIINGIHFRREAMRRQMMAAQAYGGYPGQGGYGYGGYTPPAAAGYTNYPMQPEPMLTTTQNPSTENAAASRPRQYLGFGSFREFRYGGFAVMLTSDADREFGKGFAGDSKEKMKEE